MIVREDGRVSRIADLFVANIYAQLSAADVAALQDFARAGGGIIFSGQGW